ncbi:MerR family transcriptional regulator [Bacillus carboniphilus]|uniref:MerR family transcriptional regulator n=1 Tax=Bacillus carboniphilus TaxID=86663 RepID=A0ABY9JUG5_9BACI|nr:MerR family transcriptional regulator [Bacillus carboniphilus]WLR43057.1 MerR family transcriptional regulator [Bacillus carboniphilus]
MSENKMTISKAAKKLKVKNNQLKTWEDEFSECLFVDRDSNNARVYTEETIDLFHMIKEMKETGTSDQDIKMELNKLHEEKTTMPIKQEEFIPDIYNVTALIEKVQCYLDKDSRENEKNKEERLIKSIQEIVHHEVESAATLQINEQKKALTELSVKIDQLEETSLNERDLYQIKISSEQEQLKEKLDEREQRFLSFVEKYQKKKDQRNENKKFQLLKGLAGFVK